jgi:hypothetical protein
MFVGDVDQVVEYVWLPASTRILPEGIVTSGASHGSDASRQIRIVG